MRLIEMFEIMEVQQIIPEVSAEIPGIGKISNLYDYMLNALTYCLLTQQDTVEKNFQYNQLLHIFAYLQQNGLISYPDKIIPQPITPKIDIAILEVRISYLVAKLTTGLNANEIEREKIMELWGAISKGIDKKTLYELNQLRHEIQLRNIKIN